MLNASGPSDTGDAALRQAGLLVLLVVPLQSVPLPIQAQIAPLSSIVAIGCLPFLVLADSGGRGSSSIFKAVVLFASFTVVHSVLALFVHVGLGREGTVHALSWLRQAASLLGGIAVFLVMREAFRWISDDAFVKAIAWGAVVPVVLGVANLLWGLMGIEPLGTLVEGARGLLVGREWVSPMRSSGTSLEPAHFAVYLLVVAIPVLVAGVRRKESKRWTVPLTALLVGAVLSLVWTFSGVGALITMIMLTAVLFSMRSRAAVPMALLVAVVVVGGGGVIVSAASDTYLARQIAANLQGIERVGSLARLVAGGGITRLTLSAQDMFYSTFGPIIHTLDSPELALGIGLGGTATHLKEVVPEAGYRAITALRFEEFPSLGTLVGRVYAEIGLVGLLLFGGLWVTAGREIGDLRRALGTRLRPGTGNLYTAAWIALIGFAVAAGTKIASYVIPYLWVWLAYLDCRATEAEVLQRAEP